jgi:hypothetical protein
VKASALERFIETFALPMISGGEVEVGPPYSSRDRDEMLSADSSPLANPELRFAMLRRGQELVAEPPALDPGLDDLSMWLGLHNVLLLDHPDTQRVWTRSTTWERVESETRTLLTVARSRDAGEAFARHVALAGFLALEREDHLIVEGDGERRYHGQRPPPRRLSLFGRGGEERAEVVGWIHQPHSEPTNRLLADALWASPLTCLLMPAYAPTGWSPLMAVDFMRSRALARAVCYRWARDPDWLHVGALIAGSLLSSLGLRSHIFGGPEAAHTPPPANLGPGEAAPRALTGSTFESGPEEVGAVVGSLIHLHLLKVLEFDARVGAGAAARDWAVQTFLALPLLLPSLERVLGSPWAGTKEDGERAQRWEEYTDHLRSMLPKDIVENLLASLGARIVETSPA